LDVAFSFGASHLMRLKERVLQLNERLTGTRLLRSIIVAGGVKKDLTDEEIKFILKEIKKIKDDFEETIKILFQTNSLIDRIEFTGVVKKEIAEVLGAVGPIARASGVDRDVRRDHPYAAYAYLSFLVPVFEEGDVESRMKVKIQEVYESYKLIAEALSVMPPGSVKGEVKAMPASQNAFGYTESPRGECFHWIATDRQGRISRWKIHSPSFVNWPLIQYAVLENIVPDFPLINKSLNLSYSGNENLHIGEATIPYQPGCNKAPEGFMGAPHIDATKCTGCGQCVLSCPTDALRTSDNQVFDRRSLFLSYGDCITCGLCGPACPYDAITFQGKYELAAKDKQDLTLEFPVQLSKCSQDPAFLPQDKLPLRESPGFSGKRKGPSAPLSLKGIEPQLKNKINRLFGRSLHIREVDAGSCNGCEVEIVNLSNPIYDVERFGIHFVASPRHADMLLVTGPVTRPMALALKKTYAATPSPKLVVACGGCAISGGILKGSYAVKGGVDQIVPVDVFIPGCPPRPEAILYGIFIALDKVKTNENRRTV
jgi:Ni,Fe-hydrogenase III small subunit/formate hydrogenlyase subunit 6/NADH:ubiquinone oxidoreductase subunit I